MSGTQDRSSSIPRLSRLPRPIAPSTSTSSLRPQPSRDSLSGRITPSGDIQNPKLRTTASRNSLRSTSSNSDVPHTYVRQCASRDQLRPGGARTASHKVAPPAAKAPRAASSSRRWSTVTNNPTSQYKPWADPRSSDPGRDGYIRGGTPSEDVPELLLNQYLNGTLGNSHLSEDAEPLSASSDGAFSDLGRIGSRKPQVSLSERTVDTLAHIPSSPTVSRKSSTFFDQSRRGSLAETTGSRPESSYNSETSSVLASPTTSKLRASTSRGSLTSSRLSNVRPKGLGPLKKPSLSALATAHGRDPDSPSSPGWDGAIRPLAPAVNNDAEAPAFVKSSSALRDQIAKAKAAKRAAMKHAGGDDASSVGTGPIAISPATGVDYDSAYDDPFNLNKGGNKILKQRVNAARTSGRLNIAALGLKEIPSEVMKMYDYESIQESGGNWAESVDLTRFIAADNELERLDDSVFPDRSPESFDDDEDTSGNIFGGLETVDMHGNRLTSVPVGMRRLAHLTSLNLSGNRLDNGCIAVISQITSLRDLKLAKNCLAGPLDASLSDLGALETLDIHSNQISSLPAEIEKMSRLRILILSDNNFESIGFEGLAKLPMTELDLKGNKLSGTLIEDSIGSLDQLQTFDVSSNRLTRLVPEGASISFPVLHTLLLSMNRLQELPDMSTWSNLLTLTADTNNISAIHESFASLMKLRQADFSGNDIKVVLPEIARMENLSMLRLSGNPLRDKKFLSASTDEIKITLTGRLEPPPPYQEPTAEAPPSEAMSQLDMNKNAPEQDKQDGEKSDEDEHFATPPTSAFQSPSRSRGNTIVDPNWQVKLGGLLDQSRSESTTLDPNMCARVAAQHRVEHAQLHHNHFASIPKALGCFSETLSSLALGHNQMVGETYLTEELSLPALKELNLTSNHITSLGPLTKFLRAPSLEKIDVSMNRLSALPPDLKQAFPKIKVLLASNNHLVELDPASIKGLQIVDVSSNDIAHLDPRIGLLGGDNGLQKLEVTGNRFRVPRWNVLERGTEATMRWLRGRVSAVDMAAWKVENGDDGSDDVD